MQVQKVRKCYENHGEWVPDYTKPSECCNKDLECKDAVVKNTPLHPLIIMSLADAEQFCVGAANRLM